MITEITLARKQTIKGPGGIKIELDADEIYPNDPGQGTPILVVIGTQTASYNCAGDTGECGDTFVLDNQMKWLNDLDYALDTWLTNFVRAGK